MSIQKRWKVIGAIAGLMTVLGYPLGYYLVSSSDAFAIASQFIRSNPDAIRVAGSVEDVSLSWSGFKMSVSGGSGHAQFTVNIRGSSSAPQAYLELQKRGVWEITFVRLLPKDKPPIVLKDNPR